MKNKYKFGIIGCGNMADAILSGAIKNKIIPSYDVLVYDSNIDKALSFAEKYDVCLANSNADVAERAEYVMLAIKPQSFYEVTDELQNVKYLISIMAGVKIQSIVNALPNLTAMARIMPNAPVKVSKGMSGISFYNGTEENKTFVNNLFSSIGETLFVDENKLDAVTAISGSGPAYVYYFIKSMIDAGVSIGLTEEESKKLTYQTFFGATTLSFESDFDLSTLIDMVCSKGGTTIQAIDCFNQNKTDEIIKEAIQKCYARSIELSEVKK